MTTLKVTVIILEIYNMLIYSNSEGSIIIDDIVQGYLFTRVYMGYTKKEAIHRFKVEVAKQSYSTLRSLTRVY